jgi:hypothetical protein
MIVGSLLGLAEAVLALDLDVVETRHSSVPSAFGKEAGSGHGC